MCTPRKHGQSGGVRKSSILEAMFTNMLDTCAFAFASQCLYIAMHWDDVLGGNAIRVTAKKAALGSQSKGTHCLAAQDDALRRHYHELKRCLACIGLDAVVGRTIRCWWWWNFPVTNLNLNRKLPVITRYGGFSPCAANHCVVVYHESLSLWYTFDSGLSCRVESSLPDDVLRNFLSSLIQFPHAL